MLASRYYEVDFSFNLSQTAISMAPQTMLDASAMPQEDDVSLIQRVASKDRQAFEILYNRYYQRLSGYLFKILRRTELVEEAVNDVMLVVWNDASRFSHKSRLSTWMFGIAYYKALKVLSRKSGTPSDLPPEIPEVPDPDNPEAAMTRKETSNALTQALQALSPAHRSVVELTFYHGFSYQEISEIVGCPVNTVKTRMFHARKHLGQLLSGLGVH